MNDEYVFLARATVEMYAQTGRIPIIKDNYVMIEMPELYQKELPQSMLSKKAGIFVSIHKKSNSIEEELRGCIGTIGPTRPNIAEEIIYNAISASIHDPRFTPITPEELTFLTYSVDELGNTEHITSIKQLDVKRYGVIVTKGYRRGLLLPNLDGVNTVEQQIQIACTKAGIEPEETPDLERFEVTRHTEQ